jgi:hypothetical protein
MVGLATIFGTACVADTVFIALTTGSCIGMVGSETGISTGSATGAGVGVAGGETIIGFAAGSAGGKLG